MYTLIVDDRELIVKLMLNIMGRLDPGGTHLGANNPDDALRLAKASPLDVAFLDHGSGYVADQPEARSVRKKQKLVKTQRLLLLFSRFSG